MVNIFFFFAEKLCEAFTLQKLLTFLVKNSSISVYNTFKVLMLTNVSLDLNNWAQIIIMRSHNIFQ